MNIIINYRYCHFSETERYFYKLRITVSNEIYRITYKEYFCKKKKIKNILCKIVVMVTFYVTEVIINSVFNLCM